MTIDPQNCQTMAEVRAGVDAVDLALVTLLAQRFDFMKAAARIKQDRNLVRDEVRKAAVIANVRAHAQSAGIPEPLVAAMWDMLIEGSISYELNQFDELRAV